MQTSMKLETIRQITESTCLAKNDSGLEFLVISRPESEAIISLFGAHLVHFAPRNQSPWFWLSPAAVLDGSRGIRGGVPICWPWFGPSPERVGTGKVQHGFARTALWQLDGISDTSDGTLIHLSVQDSETSRTIWPYAFSLEYDLLINEELTLLLTTRNTGDSPLVYGGALHSYFTISDPEAVSVQGLGASYIDKLDQMLEKESGVLRVNGPLDRIYNQPESVTQFVTGAHTLQLRHGHADSVVVWTPWVEGSHAMNDVNDEAWQQMLCVETAITSPAGVTVQPDDEHSLSVKISGN